MRHVSLNQLQIRVQQLNDALQRKGPRNLEAFEAVRICFELLRRLQENDPKARELNRKIRELFQ